MPHTLVNPSSPARTARYAQAMEKLVDVVQDLSHARDLDTVMHIVRTAARALTEADGASFVLRDGDNCYYADEDAVAPLWKGKRFPLQTCISGWVMLNAAPVVIEDIYKDPRIPVDAYRPTFVKSLAMVPIRKEKPVGAIGNYWAAQRLPAEEDVALLQALANVTSVTMENLDLMAQLKDKVRALEESNEDLSRFAWAASHDLKSPLRAIDHLSSWIAEDIAAGLKDESLARLDHLRKRARRMEQLLNDILSYATLEHKMDAAATALTDGRTLMEDVLALTNIPPGFTLRVSPAFDGIRAQRLPLQRVLCNLVGNAVKHHDGKEGTIGLEVTDEGAHYVFTVRDDGPGIPAGYREKVFEMFQTLKPRDVTEGSGMGLAIVRKIVALHGGSISLEPGGARGCVFRFTWRKPA